MTIHHLRPIVTARVLPERAAADDPQRVLDHGTLPRLTTEQCTPTPYATPTQKKNAGNALLTFIETGLDPNAFTTSLYKTLSVHLFGHIAHFGRDGFAHVWFADPRAKAAFIKNALAAHCGGDPAHTWCDVEQHIQEALEAHPELTRPDTWGDVPPRHPCPHCTC